MLVQQVVLPLEPGSPGPAGSSSSYVAHVGCPRPGDPPASVPRGTRLQECATMPGVC